jgi:hypothetical protein
VPTAGERSGDYSQFSGVIRDPLGNVPFPGNVIPTERLGGVFGWHVPGG